MTLILRTFSAVILFSPFLFSQQVEYQVFEIPIQYSSDKVYINDNGVIQNYRWIWNNGLVIELPVEPFQDMLNVQGFNDSSTVAGNAHNFYSNSDTSYWLTKAFRYDGGQYLTSLGVPPGYVDSLTGTESVAINNMGVIAATANGTNYIVNNGWTLLNLANTDKVKCINDLNNIAGYHIISGNDYAFALIDDAYIDIGGQMYGWSSAADINNSNQVVGRGQISGSVYEGFLFDNNVLYPLGFLPGGSFSQALAINEEGVIVGDCYNSGYQYKAVIWKDSTITDLNNVISPDSGWVLIRAHDINNAGEIVGLGTRNGSTDYKIFLLKPNYIHIQTPQSSQLLIAGEKDTIRWDIGGPVQFVSIEYSTDGGSTYTLIDEVPAEPGEYVWDVPSELLSTKMRIKISDAGVSEVFGESDLFRSKPYIITRLDENGDYYVYEVGLDEWGFGNYPGDIWPPSYWFGRFDYNNDLDPISNHPYNQVIADSAFYYAFQFEFPDWPSFVRAFGTDACYWYVPIGRYKSSAVLMWKSKKKLWGGSCFGIAAANSLAFGYKDEFANKYPGFTPFEYPFEIQPADTNVIPVITELFTHQFGNPSIQNDISGNGLKTPSQTVEDLKEILKEDNTPLRTITMLKQSGGGHTILAYRLGKDEYYDNLYYVYVYDNSYPDILDARIVVDIEHNGGVGLWDPEYAWDGWGGESGFYLEIPSQLYFTNPALPKTVSGKSPFLLKEDELKISINPESSIMIKDASGNRTGYVNNEVLSEIPGSVPLMIKNGSEAPPYAFHLPVNDYNIVLNSFSEDTIEAYLFTGIKSFEYERYGAVQTQTDRLFFDGGLSVSNPDPQPKAVKLMNIINDTSSADEKLFLFRSLDLAQNDSIKIINPDNNKIDLISYGSAKNYQIELEYGSEVISSRFFNNNINLSANTTHKLVPNWGDFADLILTIYVDQGNDGTIDDTLEIENQLTDVNDDQGSLIPKEYRLEQNYPNPFNNSTVIKYSIPEAGQVTIKVYNIIGEEVAALVNEFKQAGKYELLFQADKLTSGVYLYQIKATPGGGQAGDTSTGSGQVFVQTKKMILLK